MQYWVIFFPGVGGDGFVNLLEHANNVRPIDNHYCWRIHWKNNQVVKFYGQRWTKDGNNNVFRRNPIHDVELVSEFGEFLSKNINFVIGAHYTYWDHIKQFPQKSIIETNQYKIHLYSTDYQRILNDAIIKNNLSVEDFKIHNINNYKLSIEKELNSPNYDIHIDIDRVWKDWGYLKNVLDSIGIDLDKKIYNQYLQIAQKI